MVSTALDAVGGNAAIAESHDGQNCKRSGVSRYQCSRPLIERPIYCTSGMARKRKQLAGAICSTPTIRNIYVCSQRTGGRLMDSVERFLKQRLKLTANRKKGRVARKYGCLGDGMSWHQQPRFAWQR